MERILPQLRGSLAHYLQGFVHPSWFTGFLNHQQYHESLVLDRRYYENTGENESDSCDDGTATRMYDNWVFRRAKGAALDLPKILNNIFSRSKHTSHLALVHDMI